MRLESIRWNEFMLKLETIEDCLESNNVFDMSATKILQVNVGFALTMIDSNGLHRKLKKIL